MSSFLPDKQLRSSSSIDMLLSPVGYFHLILSEDMLETKSAENFVNLVFCPMRLCVMVKFF